MKRLTITLTEAQAWEIVRVLEFGKHYEEDYYTGKVKVSPEDKKHNAFIQRIQTKINAELVQ